jgi:hypothetical protein
MAEKAVIDRFEGSFAVVFIGEKRLDVPRGNLPKGVKEGTWLMVEISGDTLVSAQIDAEETARAKKRILEKLERLRKGEHRSDK